jgi:hypothetical protein
LNPGGNPQCLQKTSPVSVRISEMLSVGRFYFLRLIKRISEETKKAAATARRIFPTSNAVIFSTNTAKIMTKLIAIIMRE